MTEFAHKTAIVYRERIGRTSETFIASQTTSLRRYRGHMVCISGSDPILGGTPVTRLFGNRAGRVSVGIRRSVSHIPARAIGALSATNPALVHSHFGVDSVLAMTLADRLRVPLVSTFHGFDAFKSDWSLRRNGYASALYVQRRRQLVKRCVRFIAVSNCVADALMQVGVPPDRIVRHYIGVDTRFFCPPTGPRSGKPTVVFVGRLVQSKGAHYLIQAMSMVQARHPGARLVIIGDGPDGTRLRRLATAERVRAVFIGAAEPRLVLDWLRQAAVVSVPSVPMRDGYVEALGLAQVEAQAVGVPVASFATGGIGEAIAHGETGLLAPARDWKALARNISELLSDQSLWNRFSIAARQRTCKIFDLRRQTETLEGIYDEAVSDGRISVE